MDISVDALLTGRVSATAIAEYRRRLTPDGDALDWECEEDTSGHIAVAVPDEGDPPVALSMGTVVKGRFLFLLASEAVAVYINGADTDPFYARLLMLESDDTVGITSIHVENIGTAAVDIEYLIGGDIPVTP